MNASIVGPLIAKDLYLLRPMIVGALVLGSIAIAVMPNGATWFFVGWLLLYIAVILLGIFTTAVGLTLERKERVHLFVLTLPTSPAQYTAAKLAANAIAFFAPWTVLTAAALILVAMTALPDGLMPFLAIVLLFAVCYHCVYLAVALVTDSPIWSTAVIVFGNVAPAFFIPAIYRMPEVGPDAVGPVWTSDVLTILAVEVALCVAVLGVAIIVRSRHKDFL